MSKSAILTVGAAVSDEAAASVKAAVMWSQLPSPLLLP
jgi:hypothetical protein